MRDRHREPLLISIIAHRGKADMMRWLVAPVAIICEFFGVQGHKKTPR